MAKALEFDTRCGDCKQRIPAGQPVQFDRTADGVWVHSHPDGCPEKPSKAQNLPSWDREDPFVQRKCAECGQLWSFRKGGLIVLRCPSRRVARGEVVACGGRWLRKDTDPDEGWAA